MSTEQLRAAIRDLMPRARADLAQMVSVKSVHDAKQFPPEECQRMVDFLVDAFSEVGLRDVQGYDTPDGTQSVYGYLPGPPGAPTVLLYSHYDVQPPLDEAGWDTPAFELTERDGRWYGRGAADCKGGIVVHLLALRALGDGGCRSSVKVIGEGSEEQGTGGLEGYAAAPRAAGRRHHRHRRRGQLPRRPADGDRHPARHGQRPGDGRHPVAGQPALRAVRRRRARRAGRADPRAGLAARRGRQHDRRRAGPAAAWAGHAVPEEQFRKDAKVLDGVELIGDGTVADRIWARPAVTVLGIDCPPVVGARRVQARPGR